MLDLRTLTLQAKNRLIEFPGRPLIMGVVNVTPDSFSDGGRYFDAEAAVAHAIQLVKEGADLLDIGAESTRPGAEPVDEGEELRRAIPVVTAVARAVTVPISIDTSKAAVAQAALDAGAVLVNDVTALRGDPAMVEVIARTGAGIVLMHMQGTPRTMQQVPQYEDVVGEVVAFFEERIRFATTHGIGQRQIVLDPGIGFGKLLVHNLTLLARLHRFACFGCPLLVGVSRKTFLGQLVDRPVQDRQWATAAAVAMAVERGAGILRVHDVTAMKDVMQVTVAISQETTVHMKAQHA
ncbi:MAG: dihydropteroate synthase [Nitrospirota bacterium]|nr:dihydropteroate synthase [Nitrospirota bacterium]MDP2383426.1 dihydropteroate synthase [Nitrospirota bacterium]MDP3598009.1 dihydropteroate synthase [Nitrospirota bacterium]